MSKKPLSVARVYARLLRCVWRYWYVLFIALLGNLLSSGIDAFFVYFLKPVLDKGFIAKDPQFLRWLPAMVMGVFVLRGVTSLVSNYALAFVARHVVMNLRIKLFEHLQRLPASFYDKTSSGTLLSALLYNVEQVASASASAVTIALQSVGLIIGLLIVMFSISWTITLFYFAILPVIALIVRIGSRRTRQIARRLQGSMADLTNVFEENIKGYKEVRAFGGNLFEHTRFMKFIRRNWQHEMKNVVTKSVMETLVQLVAGAALAITIYIALSPIRDSLLSAGGFVALIGAMLAILKPMKNLTQVNNAIQRGVTGAQSVFLMLDEAVENDQGTIALSRCSGEICIENLNFSYANDAATVLKNINLSVRSGERIALVGHSGGGKSTLINLLPLFYQDFSGTIYIDGINSRQYCLTDLRQQFALVSQHVVLFNDTIANNISYGQAIVSREAIIAAAKAAFAHDFIMQLPQAYDTVVGQNGVLLSGGQRQRLAIARAILKNAPILILDEATSALDSESEKHIQMALQTLMMNRTTIIIAHRLSTIEGVDKIVVIDHGQIIEQGDHVTLLANNGVYADLYRHQFTSSSP